MGENIRLGFEIKTLNNLISRRMEAATRRQLEPDGLTVMNAWIIGFIHQRNQSGQDVYQRDVEAEFFITRSTATSILKLMEKKGYLRKESVAHDDRLKRLCLTEKAIAMHRDSIDDIEQVDRMLQNSLTDEEMLVFLQVMRKLRGILEPDGNASISS